MRDYPGNPQSRRRNWSVAHQARTKYVAPLRSQLPLVGRFWSVTLYDSEGFQVATQMQSLQPSVDSMRTGRRRLLRWFCTLSGTTARARDVIADSAKISSPEFVLECSRSVAGPRLLTCRIVTINRCDDLRFNVLSRLFRHCPKVLLTYELLRNTMGAHLNERNPKHEKI